MVKLRVTFGENATLNDIKLVDETDLAQWTVTLMPLNQDIKFDLSTVATQLESFVQDFSAKNVMWTFYENLVPYLILAPLPTPVVVQSATPTETPNKRITHKRELAIAEGKTDIAIFDITRHQLDFITHERGLKSQQKRLVRHLATAYHTFRTRLMDVYWKRLVLHNQREQRKVQRLQMEEHQKAQRLQMETIDGLVAQIMELRMLIKPPTAVTAPVSQSRMWHEWDNDNDEKAFMGETPRPLGVKIVSPRSKGGPVLRGGSLSGLTCVTSHTGSLDTTPPPLLMDAPHNRSQSNVDTLPVASYYSKPD